MAIVVGLAVCQLALFLTTVYLHRALAHRALKMRPWLALACRTILWITTGIKPRQWVAVHRKHHAFTDVEGDPHSPVMTSYAAVQFGNVGMYRRVANDKVTVARYARDLPPDRWDRVLFDHALAGSTQLSTPSVTPSAPGPAPVSPPTANGWPGSRRARACTTTTTPRRHRPIWRWQRARSTPPGRRSGWRGASDG